MADDSPTRARWSASNSSKSQTVRGKQANNASSRSKVVTRPRTLLLPLAPFWRTADCACATQPGRKTSPPRRQTLISNSHLWAARMACPMRVVRTCRKTPRQDQAANTAGSRSLAAVQHCRRNCSVPSLLLPGGPPSNSGSPIGRTAVPHAARRVLNRPLRAHPIGACA
jgi:hypothetical protein